MNYKHLLIAATLLLFSSKTFAQGNVAINATGTSPNASAMLDITSTDKGLLIPRMNTSQRNAISPVQGLMVYDTDLNQFWYYNGTAWGAVGAGGSGDITDVTAGAGLTGGATSGAATLDIGAGTGITVNANDVSLSTTAVTPGSYTTANITVDAYGRLTAASNGSPAHYIGELFGGGVVVYVDETGQHGWILSSEDLGTSVWSNVSGTAIGASAQSKWDGSGNTAAITSQGGHTASAAKVCDDYTGGGFTDWYLLSADQGIYLESVRYVVDKVLDQDGNGSTYGITNSYYWSSTEVSAGNAYYYDMRSTTSFVSYGKSDNGATVRAARNF